MADFGNDLMLAQRGAVAAGAVSQAELRSRNFVGFDEFAIGIIDSEFLVSHTDNDVRVFGHTLAGDTEESAYCQQRKHNQADGGGCHPPASLIEMGGSLEQSHKNKFSFS